MIKKLSIAVSFFFTVLLGLFYYYLQIPSPWITHHHIKYLSYIPSIEFYSIQEPLYHVSLKKINLFQDDDLDEFAKMEKFYPVIDKVIYIPDGFHEYANFHSQNNTGKIG